MQRLRSLNDLVLQTVSRGCFSAKAARKGKEEDIGRQEFRHFSGAHPFVGADSYRPKLGPKNHILDGGPDPLPREGAFLGGGNMCLTLVTYLRIMHCIAAIGDVYAAFCQITLPTCLLCCILEEKLLRGAAVVCRRGRGQFT